MIDFAMTSLAGSWIRSSLFYLILLLNLIFVIIIISEKRNPVKSLAWISVLMFMPVVGFIFYIFFGRDQRSQRMISRKGKRKLKRLVEKNKDLSDTADAALDAETISQIKLGYNLTGASLTHNNKITLFTDGKAKFDALFSDIAEARSFIHLQYYILDNDDVGSELKSLLIEKARSGVEVRILYDDVGCWSWRVGHHYFDDLIAVGVQAKPFFKVTFPQLANKLNYRNHRKVAIIDGKKGYLGGMNVADRYRDGVSWGVWRDTHIRIEGNAVHELQSIFLVDWNFTTKELLSKQTYFPKIEPNVGKEKIQLVTSGPLDENKPIALMFLKGITNAKYRVYIQTPYFLPSSEFVYALQIAALSGVDVRIMLPDRSDSPVLQRASQSYITQMLKAGVKIYFYTAGFMHAKAMIIDDEFTTIGSTNFDFRSFEQNFEINAFIYGRDFNATYAAVFEMDRKNCRRITLRSWRKRSMWRKVTESVLRLLSPLL